MHEYEKRLQELAEESETLGFDVTDELVKEVAADVNRKFGRVATELINHLVDYRRYLARGRTPFGSDRGAQYARMRVLQTMIEHPGVLDTCGIDSKARVLAELIVLRDMYLYREWEAV